ncbi:MULTISPECIES: LuxR family transcriptional regulator [Thermocrispum]|jgi:DNA-binding CsgD family transcriptional regulator|uniref:helix-turn-helix transcriptional regulator n=1 Tax=Thermocrispum TaxID=37924 RepID=UPI0003F79907|nr:MULTISPECIES: LuxR family transcriptional regulator [Thermocrispum]
MKRPSHDFVGRRAELDALHQHTSKPALVVVRGDAGSGKTSLLRRFCAETEAAVLDLGGVSDDPAWDEFRARALLDAVRADFEVLGEGTRLAEAIEGLSKLAVPESYAAPGRRHRLLGAISVLLCRIKRQLVIVVDDADRVPVSALASMHRAGHAVVAACATATSIELCRFADAVVELGPLTDDEIARLLTKLAPGPLDEAVPKALQAALGPLYGNAAALVSTVHHLLDQGRLAKVHGVLALRELHAPIPLPPGHRLVGHLDATGKRLVAVAATEQGLRVDRIPDLADEAGHAADDYGRAADRLVRAGILVHGEDGRLRCVAPAVGAAVACADGSAAGKARPVKPLAHYIANGEYGQLRDLVAAEVAAAGHEIADQDKRTELAAAAALAALHTGCPVPEQIGRVLAGPAIRLADRWFAGETGGVHQLVDAITDSFSCFAQQTTRVVDGSTFPDLVPVLRALLGSHYSAPAGGPVTLFHRVRTGYVDGRWSEALSAARELELTPAAGKLLHDAARLLAADICGWRAEDRQATAWLSSVDENTAFPALRAWVQAGLRVHGGDPEGALAEGWAWLAANSDRMEEPGAARLLLRLATIAADLGDREAARNVLWRTRGRYGPAHGTSLLVKGIVERDVRCLCAAERVIRAHGTRFELIQVCQRLGVLSEEPRRWLDIAYELVCETGAARLIATTKRVMADCGVTVRARRGRNAGVTEMERRIVELIRLGKTNRQIALALQVSTKTVEKHLTRLFAKVGCRTRHGLAVSSFGEQPELVGA